MSRPVLVVNAGSSSLKYQLVVPDSGEAQAAGLLERIGQPGGLARHASGGRTHRDVIDVHNHAEAFTVLQRMFQQHGPRLDEADPVAVGHRVVHGGSQFRGSVAIDDRVIDMLRDLVPLAPLHNPGNITGIEVALEAFPHLPQVAVFDTAFHQSMPPAAYTYAVPREWRERHQVRRYGFHGTSHAYVARRAAQLLGKAEGETDVVVLHLGNGASATAVAGGRSVDTTMGLTPLEGLVMGTRPGDLDPGLPGHLHRVADIRVEDYDRALSQESGLLGLCGSSDFRDVVARRAEGDPEAGLAFDVVTHRLMRHLGGLALVLGRLDAVAFTGGIGEHSRELRAAVLERAALLGIHLDPEANERLSGEGCITTEDSPVASYVIPTNEEWEIAREVVGLLRHPSGA